MVESTRPRNVRRANALVLPLLAASAACALGAAALLLQGHPAWAGAVGLLGTAALAAAGPATEAGSPRARFAGRLMEPVLDAALLTPLAWTNRASDPTAAVLSLVGLGLGLLAAYGRARGAALGYATGTGLLGRAARTGALCLGLMAGSTVAGLWAYCALAAMVAAGEAIAVVKQERGGAS
ncbi:MAG TPA: hypothetical protein VGH10_12620 [Actinomycetota bacterium]|jgi:hypothetical protein